MLNVKSEPLCNSWSFNVESFTCYLKSDYNGTLSENEEYNSGIMEDTYDSYEFKNGIAECQFIHSYNVYCNYTFISTTEVEPYTDTDFEIEQIADDDILPSCQINENRYYYGGVLIFDVSDLNTSSDCCNKCREDLYCFAWTFDKTRYICYGYYNDVNSIGDEDYDGGSFV